MILTRSRRFYAEHRGQGVIFKLNIQTHWHAQSSGARHVLFTTQLRDEDTSRRRGAVELPRNIPAEDRQAATSFV